MQAARAALLCSIHLIPATAAAGDAAAVLRVLVAAYGLQRLQMSAALTTYGG